MARLKLVVAITMCAAATAFAESGTWVGTISDSRCGGSGGHKNGPPMGSQTLSDEECVQLCIEAGAMFVLVSGGNVDAIANQKDKNLKANIGHTVEVEGELNDATITVSKIVPSHKKASKRP